MNITIKAPTLAILRNPELKYELEVALAALQQTIDPTAFVAVCDTLRDAANKAQQ